MGELTDLKRAELERLKFVSIPQAKDKELIFSLYKNLVNSDIGFYTENCSCENSIENIYIQLMIWYENNK
jgi:hypothetical protein